MPAYVLSTSLCSCMHFSPMGATAWNIWLVVSTSAYAPELWSGAPCLRSSSNVPSICFFSRTTTPLLSGRSCLQKSRVSRSLTKDPSTRRKKRSSTSHARGMTRNFILHCDTPLSSKSLSYSTASSKNRMGSLSIKRALSIVSEVSSHTGSSRLLSPCCCCAWLPCKVDAALVPGSASWPSATPSSRGTRTAGVAKEPSFKESTTGVCATAADGNTVPE
mmetsp:Transcript_13156/g.35816  ORF Transcript_13156/g.35816 Transcript_13156/m.35816 type:complete len:219 (-) Transcript_13156:438-1094(-)